MKTMKSIRGLTNPEMFPALRGELAELDSSRFRQMEEQVVGVRILAVRLAQNIHPQDAVSDLQLELPRLAESARILGFPMLGLMLGDLERMLPSCRDDRDARRKLARGAEEIERLVRKATIRQQGLASEYPFSDAPIIYLLENDDALADMLTLRLGAAGYQIRRFVDLAELVFEAGHPHALIVDVMPSPASETEQTLIREALLRWGNPPLIAVFESDDLNARLSALRSGAARCLKKPFDMERLVAILDGKTGRKERELYRVLLVVDNLETLTSYAQALAGEGMKAYPVTDAFQTLNVAREANPDVIVLDMAAPNMTALELTSLLREDDAFAHTPILFLSGVTGLGSQLAMLDAGIDDFLVKPVLPAHLAMAVATRARRSRHMQRVTNDLRYALAEKNFIQSAIDQHAIVSMTDVAGTIIYVNRKFEEISGYCAAELIGQNHCQLKSGVHPDSFYEKMWETISSGKIWKGTVCNQHKDGSPYWVESTIVPFLDANGLPYRYASVRTDITERQRMEDALAESQDFLNKVIDTIADPIFVKDRQHRWVLVNDALCRFIGQRREDLLGRSDFDFFTEQEAQVFWEKDEIVFNSGAENVNEEAFTDGDGATHVIVTKKARYTDASGRSFIVGIILDITERKQAEDLLHAREQEFRALAENSPDPIFRYDRNFRRIYFNPAAERVAGRPPSAMVGGTPAENLLLVSAEREKVMASIRQVLKTGSPIESELKFLSPEGSTLYFHNRLVPEWGRDGEVASVLSISRDITNRKMDEIALRESQGRLEEAQRIGHMGNWEADLASGTIYWSREIYRIFGQDPANFEPSMEVFYRLVHPEDLEKVLEGVQFALRDGNLDIVHRIVLPDGRVRYVHELGETVFHADSSPIRLAGTVQDITFQKETEFALIAARDEAERANRAKSDFVSNMSHELRTPMNAVLGFAQLLELDDNLCAEQRESLQQILKAGGHLLDLINEVLDLATVESGRIDLSMGAVDCTEVVEECCELVALLANARGIALRVTPHSALVRADRGRLKQVLLNLLSNAIKYNREQGSVIVDTVVHNGSACVRVSDTGEGILHERQAELFQSFSRLGAENSGVEGTGIGLMISRRLVEMMGGTIGVDSTPGFGSTFWVGLPLATSLSEAPGE